MVGVGKGLGWGREGGREDTALESSATWKGEEKKRRHCSGEQCHLEGRGEKKRYCSGEQGHLGGGRRETELLERFMNEPVHIDLKKDRGLTIEWGDGGTSYFSIAYLRKMSPSADQRELRKEMERNPLTVLPARAAMTSSSVITATTAELVGNYAIRVEFSDGHRTGLYTWDYLRSIDPALKAEREAGPRDGVVNPEA